jgi:hypothetical protein
MICTRRLVFKLIGTDDEEAGAVWRALSAEDQRSNTEARKILVAWALNQAGSAVRKSRIVSVTTYEDPAIDGPVSLEVAMEGATEAELDSRDRSLFTMLERRREIIDAMLAKSRWPASRPGG